MTIEPKDVTTHIPKKPAGSSVSSWVNLIYTPANTIKALSITPQYLIFLNWISGKNKYW